MAGAELFATRGFHGVSIEDLGRAVGTTGPALYRHFPGKDALLAAILIDVSERLLAGADERLRGSPDPDDALDALLAGHVEFALTEPALITVHDRELDNVPPEQRRIVRRLQRQYVECWVRVLGQLRPDIPEGRLRAKAHATFGLLNSTPHSAGDLALAEMSTLLRSMGRAALLA
ncbi:TetR/AcrR family transcriptional regulator [Lipingzhangella sp. LS1_29]|uniref:TetR/AcrR family transcriptional regulator n=1 Tax=Lipingzhangella rawalii TaxID=2055835 RepID=A0ABU2H2P3_9ACTN|nr:TetR/AcrR family transcriptional regulator [Lipingzhangella rawalii]MDS1269578.1 TetR/AcrR family transcriptional regulator [Lipingzhangella rawalii]